MRCSFRFATHPVLRRIATLSSILAGVINFIRPSGFHLELALFVSLVHEFDICKDTMIFFVHSVTVTGPRCA